MKIAVKRHVAGDNVHARCRVEDKELWIKAADLADCGGFSKWVIEALNKEAKRVINRKARET